MRCLVTGGSGFLGSVLTHRLVREGHQVAVLSRTPRPWRLEDVLGNITILPGNLQNLRRVIDDAPVPDMVFHLAWEKGNRRVYADDPVHQGLNLDATRELIEYIEERRIPRVIGVGTYLEYGRFPIPTSEAAVCEPDTAYGVAKLAAGRAVLAARTSAVWVRLFWPYGPADTPEHLIPSVACALLAGKSPAVTAGDQCWDPIYVDDAVDALVRLAEADARGIFNLGSGEAVPIRSIVDAVVGEIGGPAAPRFGVLPYPQGQTMHLQADVTRIRETIGWTPATSLADGIRRTVNWYRAVHV